MESGENKKTSSPERGPGELLMKSKHSKLSILYFYFTLFRHICQAGYNPQYLAGVFSREPVVIIHVAED